MNNTLKNLKTTIFNVIEQMFFLLPDEQSFEELGEKVAGPVHIGITGDPGYIVSLTFDYDLAASMTNDLLGLENDEPDDELIGQSLRETANIIGGNFLLSFAGENRNVTLPSLIHEDIFPEGKVVETARLMIAYDGCPMEAMLQRIEM